MYTQVKKLLKESGELMIKTADGETFELHTHNAEFMDDGEMIKLDASTETYWINGNEVIYAWIHREGPSHEG